MNPAPNSLFPLILDNLSNNPLLFDTQSNLLKDLSKRLKNQGIKVNNLKEDFEETLNVGKSLGILTVQDENVRMPFQLKSDKGIGWYRSMEESTAKPKVYRSRSKSTPGTSHTVPKIFKYKNDYRNIGGVPFQKRVKKLWK